MSYDATIPSPTCQMNYGGGLELIRCEGERLDSKSNGKGGGWRWILPFKATRKGAKEGMVSGASTAFEGLCWHAM